MNGYVQSLLGFCGLLIIATFNWYLGLKSSGSAMLVAASLIFTGAAGYLTYMLWRLSQLTEVRKLFPVGWQRKIYDLIFYTAIAATAMLTGMSTELIMHYIA